MPEIGLTKLKHNAGNMRIILLSLLLVINFSLSSKSFAQRYALVIGNSDYSIGALKNPANDASDMAVVLQNKGFKVQKLTNASKKQMELAIREFTKNLHQKEVVGLFYFAGHGIEIDGRNFLIPIGANIESETDVEYEGVNAGRVMSGMNRAGNNLNMVILDACRNNPFSRSFRSASRGLARMEARGSMVLYATSPGDVAADGEGRNGLFTQHLMTSINTPNLTIDEVFNRTANEVSRATGRKQLPWKSGVIIDIDKFHFSPDEPVLETTSPPKTKQAEILFWESIKNETTKDFFASYLDQYPQGVYARLAELKIKNTNPGSSADGKLNRLIKQAHLSIKTTPDTAQVRILNTSREYQQGMVLEAGSYHIEVTQDGYQPYRKWLQLGNEDMNHAVTLDRNVQAAAISAEANEINLLSQSDDSPFNDTDFVLVDPGCFQMGNSAGEKNEKPVHQVCISSGYFIGKYEVTQAQWRKLMGFNPSYFKGDFRPVERVSWDHVQSFIRKLNQLTSDQYRLPTEAEWEFACRSAGKRQKYCGGDNAEVVAWYHENADFTTHLVGKKLANGLGIHDMSGNVWEWVQDWYEADYSNSLENNPKGPSKGAYNIIRGGSLNSNVKHVRSTQRRNVNPSHVSYVLGFRLVKTR